MRMEGHFYIKNLSDYPLEENKTKAIHKIINQKNRKHILAEKK